MGASAPRTPLGRLIGDVQAANKWSYADIAQNAAAAGRNLSRSRVESLRNDPLPSISTKAIESLAAGLKVSPMRVAEAAIESLGYPVGPDRRSTADALAADPSLSDPMRRVLLAALEAARAEGQPDDHASRLAAENRLQQRAADRDDG